MIKIVRKNISKQIPNNLIQHSWAQHNSSYRQANAWTYKIDWCILWCAKSLFQKWNTESTSVSPQIEIASPEKGNRQRQYARQIHSSCPNIRVSCHLFLALLFLYLVSSCGPYCHRQICGNFFNSSTPTAIAQDAVRNTPANQPLAAMAFNLLAPQGPPDRQSGTVSLSFKPRCNCHQAQSLPETMTYSQCGNGRLWWNWQASSNCRGSPISWGWFVRESFYRNAAGAKLQPVVHQNVWFSSA